MTVRATARFGLLRYEPGNPQFPVLPDGVTSAHFIDLARVGGVRAKRRTAARVFAAAPGVDSQRFGGWQTGKTWVNPSIVDFGVIPSPVRRTVSLYNTRSTPVDVTVFSVAAGAGVTIISPSLPQTLEAFDGITFVIEASLTGDNEFDTIATFTTSVGNSIVRLLGRRVFTVNAVPESPINESLRFKTDIIRSSNAKEKAYSLLQAPNAVVDYRVMFTDDLQRIRFKNNFAGGASALVVAAQKWYEARKITSAALSTDLVLNVSTLNGSFQVDKPISCVTPAGVAVPAQISSFTSTTITLGSAIGVALPIGTHIMPVGLGYINQFPKYKTNRVNLEEASYSVTFNQEADQSALDGMFPLLTDLLSPATSTPILEFCNEQGVQNSQLDRDEDVLDSGLSNRLAFNQFAYGDDLSDFRMTLESEDEIWKWRQFFHHLRGSYRYFYVPTFRNDIPNTTTGSGNTFVSPDTDLFLLFGDPPNDRRQAIRLLYPDGTILYRIITTVLDLGATEQITVNDNTIIGTPIISYLQRARILGDTVNFKFERPDEALMTFRYRTIEI